MAIHLRIQGKVQGVGYRAGFAAQARAMQLQGWVRNRSDGSVEAQVWGDTEHLEKLVAWARQGPPAAQVTAVEMSALRDAGQPNGRFEIVATA